MEWIAMIALICSTSPVEGVSNESCKTYYKTCIERVMALPGAKDVKGASENMLATQFYNDPSSRKICLNVIK